MKTRRLFFISALLFLTATLQAQPDSLWSHTFGGADGEWCSSLIQTTDGGFALAGETYSLGAGNSDFWLVRTDANGDSLWSRTYGGEQFDECNSLIQTTDGGFVLGGRSNSFGSGLADFWLLRTDENGDSLWSHTFGGRVNDVCFSLVQTNDDCYALAGFTESFGRGESDFWLVKTDANGDSLWAITYGGQSFDCCHSLINTEDGGFVLAGYTLSFGNGSNDFWSIRTNCYGDSLWARSLGGEQGDNCLSIIQTTNNRFVLAGWTNSFGAGRSDFWLVKTGADPVSVPDTDFILHPSSFIFLEPYPNPFNGAVRLGFQSVRPGYVALDVYNSTGRRVDRLWDGFSPIGERRLVWKAEMYPAGQYWVRLTDNWGGKAVQPVVLLK